MRRLRRPRGAAPEPAAEQPAPRRSPAARVGSALLWWLLPALAVAVLGGYLGLGLIRHVDPPVVPVLGTSMQPLLHAGDLVLLKHADVATLRKGEIIAFRTTAQAQRQFHVPGRYVHRIVRVERGPQGYQFQTKGDNVSGRDPFWTTQDNVVGLYDGEVPGAGYPILFLESLQGRILLAACGGVLLLYFLLGALERRAVEADSNALALARLVEEARSLTDTMSRTAASLGGAAPGVAAPAAPVVDPAAIHFWELPRSKWDRLGEYELAPAYTAAEPSSADWRRFEEQLAEMAAAVGTDERETLRELVAAVAEYGEHLRSHTAVMQGLAAVGENLDSTTNELRSVLAALAELLRAQRPPDPGA